MAACKGLSCCTAQHPKCYFQNIFLRFMFTLWFTADCFLVVYFTTLIREKVLPRWALSILVKLFEVKNFRRQITVACTLHISELICTCFRNSWNKLGITYFGITQNPKLQALQKVTVISRMPHLLRFNIKKDFIIFENCVIWYLCL